MVEACALAVRSRRCFILELKLGQVMLDGRVEVEAAGFHKTHGDRRRHRLGDRANLKEGIGCDR